MSKQEIISNVYYDRAGYGSRQRTLKEAREKDKSITIDDVNEFFKKNVEAKRKPVGQNSFVAPHSAYEYQMDLFFINDLEDQKFKVGMIMIDVFDKFMHVVAIKGKKEEDLASGMIECLHKMGKKPKIIYTDDEGALSKEAIQTYLKEQKLSTTGQGHTQISVRGRSELLRTCYIKELRLTRRRGKVIFNGLTYNNQMIHSATKFTPKEARKPSNELTVRLNIASSDKRNRIYPDLDKGDEVKIFRKRKPNEKERISNWSQNRYTVEKIEKQLGQRYYYVEGVDRPYLRFELIKA